MRAPALAVLVLLGCDRPGVALDLVLDEDAGPSCASHTDLRCVNYLDFVVQTEGGENLSHCLRVERALDDLCDLRELADGAELFRLDLDERVTITMNGLRVFPASGCQPYATCMRQVFSATTGATPVRLRDVAGGALDLQLTAVGACGPREEYYPRDPGETCDQVCGRENVVSECNLATGCLCRVITSKPDAGTAQALPDGPP